MMLSTGDDAVTNI